MCIEVGALEVFLFVTSIAMFGDPTLNPALSESWQKNIYLPGGDVLRIARTLF